LTATPATNWNFAGWSGDATGSANPLTVTMDANKAITATFTINTYTLTLTTVGSGTATKSPNQPTYEEGSFVTLTATPSPGYRFLQWSGDVGGTASQRSVLMNGNKVVVANFGLITRPVTLPDGFSAQALAIGLNYPVGLAFLPDGRLLFIEQTS